MRSAGPPGLNGRAAGRMMNMARKKSAASRKAANARRSAAAAAKAAKPEKNRSRRVQLHEVSLEEDIKYRAPINYRGFQIIGWICIVISVPLALLAMATKSSPAMAEKVQGILSVLRPIGRLSLPFLLLYNFSRILNNSEGYRKQLLRNGAAALGIAAASILIIERYIIGTAQSAVIQSDEILPLFTNLFQNFKSEGFFAFNLFNKFPKSNFIFLTIA